MSPGLVLLLEVLALSHHMGFYSIAPPVTHIYVPKLQRLLQAALPCTVCVWHISGERHTWQCQHSMNIGVPSPYRFTAQLYSTSDRGER